MNAKLNFLTFLVLVNVFGGILGHGRVMDPIGRSSRWRLDSSAPKNYNDMETFCGGYNVQWNQNGGKCGLCGDKYGDATPRQHELGGTFGQGVIVKAYTQGSLINVNVDITSNHRGYFYFKICNLDDQNESEACFERYTLLTSSGSDKYVLPSTSAGNYIVPLRLPSNLYCNHCVLQWTYVAGNNWGVCPDGSGALGCGPQEHFRICSDIQITRA